MQTEASEKTAEVPALTGRKSLEWVDPVDLGETGELGVGRIEIEPMLDRESCELGSV